MADDITLSNSIEDLWELYKEYRAKSRTHLRILLANLTERIENVDIDIHSEELKSQLEIPEIGKHPPRDVDSGIASATSQLLMFSMDSTVLSISQSTCIQEETPHSSDTIDTSTNIQSPETYQNKHSV